MTEPTHDELYPLGKEVILEYALTAIKDFLEWGAKTGSDRELFDDRFRKVLKTAGVEFKEPE